MARTGGEILIDCLRDWGVEVVFGLPGDGINGIMEALRRRQESIRFIGARQHSGDRRPDALGLRNARDDGVRAPVCDRGPARISRAAVRRLRRRRWVLDAPLRARDLREVRTPREDRRREEHTLGQIRWEQMVFNGNPEYGCELQPIDFAAAARAFGAAGFSVDDPTQCGPVLDEALATPGPVVVEAVVDPFEPPMPPKTTAKQAMKLAKTLVSDQAEAGKIMSTILEDKVRELV